MNKYEKIYNSIVAKAKLRVNSEEYTESHHIVPECFFINRSRKGIAGWVIGNPDDPTNLVRLTAREHFICHHLLVKMHTGVARKKMLHAFMIMQGSNDHQDRYSTKITARAYAALREEFSKHISEMNTGRIQPPDEKARQIAATTGRTREEFSPEWRANLSANHKSKTGHDCSHSNETKTKISVAMTGRTNKQEDTDKRANAIRGIPKPKTLCVHCNQLIAVNGYARFHGDKCKSNPNRIIESVDTSRLIHCIHCNKDIIDFTYNRYHGDKCSHKR